MTKPLNTLAEFKQHFQEQNFLLRRLFKMGKTRVEMLDGYFSEIQLDTLVTLGEVGLGLPKLPTEEGWAHCFDLYQKWKPPIPLLVENLPEVGQWIEFTDRVPTMRVKVTGLQLDGIEAFPDTKGMPYIEYEGGATNNPHFIIVDGPL